MERIFSVPLMGRTTDVWFGSYGEKEGLFENSLTVADSNTAPLMKGKIAMITIPAGEKYKNLQTIVRILDEAFSLSLARDSMFIGFGGGVILDMTAFAASVYMRGANVTLIPTTLLACVDATLGGKTGIDYSGYKNSVGTFFPAGDVIIDTSLLKTLDEKEWKCGLGEVIKHALLSEDYGLWGFLLNNRDKILSRDEKTVGEMIKLSLGVKISYITRDPEEKLGIRSALNLGHTFAHALETVSSFSVSHGEAVAWGTRMALVYGMEEGITDSSWGKDALSLLSAYSFESGASGSKKEDLSDAMKNDKKKKAGKIRFVLMEGQGKPILRTEEPYEVLERCGQ